MVLAQARVALSKAEVGGSAHQRETRSSNLPSRFREDAHALTLSLARVGARMVVRLCSDAAIYMCVGISRKVRIETQPDLQLLPAAAVSAQRTLPDGSLL